MEEIGYWVTRDPDRFTAFPDEEGTEMSTPRIGLR